MSSGERLYIPPQVGAPGRAAARKRRRRLLLTGLFVVSMAAVLLAIMVVLHYRAVNAIQLTTWLAFTDGLTPGAPVEQAGYTIGTVTAVTPMFPGADGKRSACPESSSVPTTSNRDDAAAGDNPLTPCFQIRLRIKQDWPIPRDSVAIIGSKLLKGTLVLIEAGRSNSALRDGDSLAGRADGSDLGAAANELLTKLTALLDHVQGIMDDTVRPLLGSINKQVGALQQLVVADGGGDGDGRGAALKDIAVVLANLKQLTADLADHGDGERDTDVGKLLRATRVAAENVEGITAAINDRSREIRKAVKQFTELGTRLNRLAANAGPSIEGSLNDTQYIIQETATALTPILNSIDETTRNLLELSRDLRDNPAVLLRGRNTHDNSPR